MNKFILFVIAISSFTINSYACDYTLILTDSYGDGWNGASIDAVVSNSTTNYTISSGYGGDPDGAFTVTFPANSDVVFYFNCS